jgi:hypothetical protein
LKPTEIILRWGIKVMNLIDVHCMHVWKYHEETPLYGLIYALFATGEANEQWDRQEEEGGWSFIEHC